MGCFVHTFRSDSSRNSTVFMKYTSSVLACSVHSYLWSTCRREALFSSRGGWCNKKKYSCVKLLNADAFFSSASRLLFCCSDVFLTRDLRSNLCHYQSARPSWCHPDAPSWNTHRPLSLLHLRFSALFSPQSWTCTNTHADARPLTLIHKSRYTLLKQHDAHTLTHKPPPVWGRCSNEG